MTKAETRSLGGRLGPGLLFALLIAAVYADPVFLRRNFAGRDLLPYNLPVEHAIHDAYARGRLPVWWEDVSGGRPLLPNPNSGALYPVRPLLAALPFPAAMRLFPVAHWIAAGIGMMLFVRAAGRSAAAAWVAAVAYSFSGVSVSEVFYSNYQPGMALLPWIAWATIRCRPPRGVFVLALLYGLDLLAGDVFTTFLALAASVLWIALEAPSSERRARFAGLAGALLLAGLLAAPQLTASALWAPHTRRAVVGLKLDEALTFSVSPWRLWELAVPYPFGATWSLDPSQTWGRLAFRSFFASLYCGALAVVGGAALVSRRRAEGRWVLALFGLAAILAVGPSFVPASWGDRPSPLPLRYPEKFAVGIVFALSAAAATGLDASRGAPRLPRWILAAGGALALAAAAAALFPSAAGALAARALSASAPAADEAARQLPAAFAEAGLLWMGTLVALELFRADRAATAGIALLLLTLVPVLANRRVARTFPEESVFRPTAFARRIDRRDPVREARVLDESRYLPDPPAPAFSPASDPAGLELDRRRWFFYTPSLWGRATIFNTDPDVGDLSRMQSLREASAFLASTESGARLFSTLGLRFGIRPRGTEPLPGFLRSGGDALQDWDENAAARPPIRLLERWREEPGAVAAFRDLASLAEGEVAIEAGRAGEGRSPGGAVRAVERSPERLRLSVEAPAPSWLFVVRGFWPYREVLLDGRAVDPVPAHLAFSAVAIPAGAHRIEWRERVPGIEISWLGPAAFAAAGAGALLRRRARPRVSA
jgi:hypothetical protein